MNFAMRLIVEGSISISAGNVYEMDLEVIEADTDPIWGSVDPSPKVDDGSRWIQIQSGDLWIHPSGSTDLVAQCI